MATLLLCFSAQTTFAQSTCTDSTSVVGGTLALADGGDSTTICAGDSISDAFEVVLTDTVGTANSAWVITDTSLNILGLPDGPPFDLEDAGPGVCYVWHLAYGDSLGGAIVDSSAANLTGCFELSNPITVTRDTGANCATTAVEAPLAPGAVTLFPNPVGELLTLDLAELTSGTTAIDILDLNGRLVERRVLESANGRHAFDLTAAPAGTYLLRVRNDGRALTRRFVKQ